MIKLPRNMLIYSSCALMALVALSGYLCPNPVSYDLQAQDVTDEQMIAYFITSFWAKDQNKAELNDEIELYIRKISKYPQPKRTFLKRVFNDYLQLQYLLYDDVLETYSQYADSRIFQRYRSAETRTVEARCIQYGLKRHIDINKALLEVFYERLQNSSQEQWLKDRARLEEFRNFITTRKEMLAKEMKKLSERLFEY